MHATKHSLKHPVSEYIVNQKNFNIESFITNYILPLGFVFFSTGILYFSSFSAYHTQTYLFLIIPTLILLLFFQRNIFMLMLHSKAFLILLLFFCFVLASLLWNTTDINDIKYVKKLLNILLFIFSIILIEQSSKKRLQQLFIITAFILSIGALYAFYTAYIVESRDYSYRIIGIGNLSNPIWSTHIYGPISVFLIYYFFSIKHNLKQNIILILLFIILISFIILTNSRASFVALGTSLIFLLLIHKSKKILYLLAIITIILLTTLIFQPDIIIKRGFSLRPEIWSSSLEQIKNNLFFGHGLGTKISIYIKEQGLRFNNIHNQHLGIIYNFGVIGFILWISLLVSMFNIYRKNKLSFLSQVGAAMLIYGIISGITESTNIFTRPKEQWFLFWLPIAILFTVEYRRLKNNQKLQANNL